MLYHRIKGIEALILLAGKLVATIAVYVFCFAWVDWFD
jgi:hypothetical protein